MTSTGTSTTAGAKAHAREQEGTSVACSPTRPAPADTVWREVISGGNYSHMNVSRGTEIKLTDIEGDACAHVLVFNADLLAERLNVADTVKVQWQVYMSDGYLLLSDQGRVLASISSDSPLHHDTLFGTSTLARNVRRYGQGAAHSSSPAGRELLALAGLKHGLRREDIAPSISFFKGVRVSENGNPIFVGGQTAGAQVTIKAEMNLVVLIANTAHPLDSRDQFISTPLLVEATPGSATTDQDTLWVKTPEGRRAFINTANYLTAKGAK
ncbi:MAG: hypothetical protein RLZZ590_242 [Actinomycetota bacterium]